MASAGARAADAEGVLSMTMVGTRHFAAPEVLTGARYNEKADVARAAPWALASWRPTRAC